MAEPDAALHQAVPGKYKPAGIPAPAPYAAQQTGTLADVVEQGPDLGGGLRPAGPDGFAPAPSFGDLVHAGRIQSRAYRMDFNEIMLRDGYAPIVDALGLPDSENPSHFVPDSQEVARGGTEMFGHPSELATRAGVGDTRLTWSLRRASRELQEQLIAAEIKKRRANDPKFAPGVPDTPDGLHQYFRDQEARKRVVANATVARSRGFTDALGVFAGSGIESFHDPVNLATLPIGGGGKSLLQTVGRETVVNGLLEAMQLPVAAHNLDELGEHLTAGEAVSDVVTAGVFGGVLGGTFHVAGEHIPPALFKAMPGSVQTRWANRMKVVDGKDAPLLKDVLGDMDNRELAGFARSTIGERMTPDEKAATNVLEREQELGEASPFMAGPSGDAAHQASLAEALKAIIDGAPRETSRGELLASTSGAAVRSPRPVPVPGHAGFETQWSAITGNEHGIGRHGEFLTSPKGAVGPAQVMPGTAPYAARLAGVPWDEARYRSDRAYNEALGRAYYAEQLQTFGDPALAAAAYNAGPGNAARGTGLRGALRKAAEHGEPGNWEAYLPRETQRYVADFRRRSGMADSGADRAIGAAAGAADEDAIAGLQRSADDAEGEGIALSRDRDDPDVDLAGDRAAIADVPVLKRELFANDEDWAAAQTAFHSSLNAPDAAPERAAAVEGGVPGPDGDGSAQRAPGEAGGANADLTVPAYVDAYLRGEGRGDTPRDRELLQFAANNGPEIEAEFRQRADATTGTRPLTMAELEEIGRPVNAKLDPLWYAGLNAVHLTELGKEPVPLWALRDKGSGEIVSWGVNRQAVEGEKGKYWEPEQLDLERLHPENVAMELRERALLQAAKRAVQDVRIDEPELKAFDDGGPGREAQAESLDHDARMDAAEQLANDQVLARNRERPRQAGLKGKAAKPIASFTQDPAKVRAKGQRKRDYYLPVTEHADHKAAKAGDLDAAERLVDDLVRPQDLERAAGELAGARFVPVIAEEAGGRNAIPLTLADRYAEAAGGTVDTSIVQSERAFHTGASPAERIVRRARFDGPVIPGERYVLVDDVAAMGGSIAELADHIQRGGGTVQRVVLLASGVDDFAPTPKQIRAIIDGGYAEHFRHFAGIEPEALTRAEAEWAISRSPERVRDQLAAAVGRRDGGQARAAPGGEEDQGGLAAGDADAPKTYRLTEEGPEQTLEQILDDLDRERDAIAALRRCADGGGE